MRRLATSACVALAVAVGAVAFTAPAQAQTAAPSAPRILPQHGSTVLLSGDDALIVTWQVPENDGGGIDRYIVQWKLSSVTTYGGRAEVEDGLTYTIMNLIKGMSYDIQVAAENGSGTSPYLTLEEITPSEMGAPSKPRNVRAFVRAESLAIDWDTSLSGGTSIFGLVSFQLRWKKTSVMEWGEPVGIFALVLALTQGFHETQIIKELEGGESYDIQVRAAGGFNAGPFSPWTDTVQATPLVAAVPDAPRNVRLAVGHEMISVGWTAPPDIGGPAVTSYKVRWKTAADTDYRELMEVMDGTSYTIPNLTNDTQYEVQVAAVNELGDSDYSPAAQAIPLAAKEGTPEKLKVVFESDKLFWSASTASDLLPLPYRLRWRVQDTLLKTWSNGDDDGLATAGTAEADCPAALATTGCRSMLLSLRFQDVTYEFQARAVNNAGVGPWSDFATTTIAGRIFDPAPITNLKVTSATLLRDNKEDNNKEGGKGRLKVAWEDLTPAGISATDYRVRWRMAATDAAAPGPWQGWVSAPDGAISLGESENGVSIERLTLEDPALLSYTITNLTIGTAYDVAVAAVNQTEIGSWVEESMTEVAAAPIPVPVVPDPNEDATAIAAPPPRPKVEPARPVAPAMRAIGAAQLSAVQDVVSANALDARRSGNFIPFFEAEENYNPAQIFTPSAPPRHAPPRHAPPRHAPPRHAPPRHAPPRLLSEEPQRRDADWRDLLGASAFRLTLNPDEERDGTNDASNDASSDASYDWEIWGDAWDSTTDFLSRGEWAVWGAGDVRGFSGDDNVEGLTYAGYVGADYRTANWLAGIAASYATTAAEVGDDKLQSDMWFAGAYPYARYTSEERVDVWLLAGAGYGVLMLDATDTPLVQHLYAAGAKADVVQVGNLTFAAKMDGAAIFSLSTGDSARDSEEVDVTQQRFRLAADLAYNYPAAAYTLRPHLEIGARIDFAQTTTPGAEVAAGIQYERTRLAINARGRALVYDGTSLLREWGAGATIRMLPNVTGEGISASLTPAWGAPQSRTDDMWNNDTPQAAPIQTASLQAELAYTVKHKQASITPLTQYALNANSQTLALGTRLNLTPLSLELLGERIDHNTNPDNYRLSLTSNLRF